MSHDARVWVWDHSLSKGTARMVLTLIADRCIDHTCTAYASVPALMRRANASRSAVRDALDKLVTSGEIVRLDGRKGPRGETYYRLPEAARFMTEDVRNPTHQEGQIPTPEVPESDTSSSNADGPESGPGVQNPTPGGAEFRYLGGKESDPQNRSEPIGTAAVHPSPPLNGRSTRAATPGCGARGTSTALARRAYEWRTTSGGPSGPAHLHARVPRGVPTGERGSLASGAPPQ